MRAYVRWRLAAMSWKMEGVHCTEGGAGKESETQPVRIALVVLSSFSRFVSRAGLMASLLTDSGQADHRSGIQGIKGSENSNRRAIRLADRPQRQMERRRRRGETETVCVSGVINCGCEL